LLHFKSDNEVIIRKKYIGEYINHAECDELYDEALRMLTMSKFTKRLTIDEDFPKDRLVEIMKPYLRIFFSHIYSLDICERNNSACELSKQLKRFYEYNPQFGRKIIRLKNGRKTNWQYNDKHIEFRGINYSLNYKDSHIDLDEINRNHEIIRRIPSPQQEHYDTTEISGVSDESESESDDDDNDYSYDDYIVRGPTGPIDIASGTTVTEAITIILHNSHEEREEGEDYSK
jgi:hypothetical protein